MAESQLIVASDLSLESLDAYHQDLVKSFRLYFSPASPFYVTRFFGQSDQEIRRMLSDRLEESDRRSSLAVLTSLEAAFRIDFKARCSKRLKDELSRHFRDLKRQREGAVRLDEDILESWKQYSTAGVPTRSSVISQIRGAFKFRHWLAHGRYWTPNWGRNYDFDYIYTLTEAVLSGFPLES